MLFLRWRNKWLRPDMPAVARPAGHGYARVIHLADVVCVDVLDHLEHHARGRLLRLCIVGKIQARPAIGPDVVRIWGVARIAVRAQCRFPAFHDVVNLLPGQTFGQHFKIRGRWKCARS